MELEPPHTNTPPPSPPKEMGSMEELVSTVNIPHALHNSVSSETVPPINPGGEPMESLSTEPDADDFKDACEVAPVPDILLQTASTPDAWDLRICVDFSDPEAVCTQLAQVTPFPAPSPPTSIIAAAAASKAKYTAATASSLFAPVQADPDHPWLGLTANVVNGHPYRTINWACYPQSENLVPHADLKYVKIFGPDLQKTLLAHLASYHLLPELIPASPIGTLLTRMYAERLETSRGSVMRLLCLRRIFNSAVELKESRREVINGLLRRADGLLCTALDNARKKIAVQLRDQLVLQSPHLQEDPDSIATSLLLPIHELPQYILESAGRQLHAINYRGLIYVANMIETYLLHASDLVNCESLVAQANGEIPEWPLQYNLLDGARHGYETNYWYQFLTPLADTVVPDFTPDYGWLAEPEDIRCARLAERDRDHLDIMCKHLVYKIEQHGVALRQDNCHHEPTLQSLRKQALDVSSWVYTSSGEPITPHLLYLELLYPDILLPSTTIMGADMDTTSSASATIIATPPTTTGDD